MKKFQSLLSHLIMILALMFAVFLVLDLFNPMMNFVDNGISRVLLALMIVCCVAQNLTLWSEDRDEDKK